MIFPSPMEIMGVSPNVGSNKFANFHLEESSQGFTGIGAPKPWLSATKMVEEKTIHAEQNGGGVSPNNLSLI